MPRPGCGPCPLRNAAIHPGQARSNIGDVLSDFRAAGIEQRAIDLLDGRGQRYLHLHSLLRKVARAFGPLERFAQVHDRSEY